MHKESDIYKYCLIEKATIPLHMTLPNTIYLLIYTLMILRTAVTYIIYKILYNSDSENNEYSSGKMTITVLILKNS